MMYSGAPVYMMRPAKDLNNGKFRPTMLGGFDPFRFRNLIFGVSRLHTNLQYNKIFDFENFEFFRSSQLNMFENSPNLENLRLKIFEKENPKVEKNRKFSKSIFFIL